ncbi:MAG: hypothetical protein RR626_07860, partial [Anaerovoracaceae bacterium]
VFAFSAINKDDKSKEYHLPKDPLSTGIVATWETKGTENMNDVALTFTEEGRVSGIVDALDFQGTWRENGQKKLVILNQQDKEVFVCTVNGETLTVISSNAVANSKWTLYQV